MRWPLTDTNLDLLKLVAGEFTDQILKIFCDHNLAAFLTATTYRQHVWLACLAHNQFYNEAACEGAEFFLRASAKEILSQSVSNLACGYIPALKKLPLGALSGIQYRALHDLLAENGARAKSIRHADALSGTKIDIIHALDDCIFSEQLLALCKTKVSAAAVSFAYHKLADQYPTIKVERFRNALLHCADSWMIDDTFVELIWGCVRLPKPPLKVREALPLESVEKIRDAGRRFDNCLAHNDDYIKKCLAGHSFLYEWKHQVGAIVQIEHDPIWGWVISEIRLKGNDHPDFEKAWPIVEAFGLPPLLIGFHRYTSMDQNELAGLDAEDSLAVALLLAYNNRDGHGNSGECRAA